MASRGDAGVRGIKLSQIDARAVRKAACGLGVAGISLQLRLFWY